MTEKVGIQLRTFDNDAVGLDLHHQLLSPNHKMLLWLYTSSPDTTFYNCLPNCIQAMILSWGMAAGVGDGGESHEHCVWTLFMLEYLSLSQ